MLLPFLDNNLVIGHIFWCCHIFQFWWALEKKCFVKKKWEISLKIGREGDCNWQEKKMKMAKWRKMKKDEKKKIHKNVTKRGRRVSRAHFLHRWPYWIRCKIVNFPMSAVPFNHFYSILLEVSLPCVEYIVARCPVVWINDSSDWLWTKSIKNQIPASNASAENGEYHTIAL